MSSLRLGAGLALLGGASVVAIACSLTGLADGSRDASADGVSGSAGCTIGSLYTVR